MTSNGAERKPSHDSQERILNEEHSQFEPMPEQASAGLKIAIVLVVLLACIAGGYGWLQHNSAEQLAAERADLRAALAQAKAQQDALTDKVNALSAAQAQAELQVEAARAQVEAAKNQQFLPQTGETSKHPGRQVSRRSSDDPRWKHFQQQLGDQQKQLADNRKQIAETQANLEQAKADLTGSVASARTELGGDIARNHDELVALEKKGERNYYEFNFEKSKAYHHTGPISIALRKADSKHEFCDLQMLVDDREITRKHVNLYESVTFHPEGYLAPLEVVINHIDKDSVQGYVSEPKYRSKEQVAASSGPPATTASVSAPSPASPDPQLTHRDADAH